MGLADWLQGCAHRRKSFPMTPRLVGSRDGTPSTQQETYVVCLDCGRRFVYDWSTMQIKRAEGRECPGALAWRTGDGS